MQDVDVLRHPQFSPVRKLVVNKMADSRLYYFDNILNSVVLPIPFRPTKPYRLPQLRLILAEDSRILRELKKYT